MGETFLASFVIVVLDLLTSDEVLNVASQLGIQPQLQKWTKILKNIRIVLADAELKRYKDTDVKNWLNKLEDLAYDMEDTIDDFVTEQVGQRPHSQASSSTSQVSVSPFFPSTDLINKIEEISTRLQEIVGKINCLSLKENDNIFGGIQFTSTTSSSLAQRHVCGREEEKKEILEILFKDEATFGEECVVPIVGMGGVGKTTLAQLLYNDKKVNSFFDLKAWACVGFVSDKFDVLGVTKKILESLTEEPCVLKELDPVHVSLQEKLLGKKFLVVLDDIWKIECDEWNSLILPFLDGARGSKIIVTTRFADVAKNMSSIKIRELKQLGDDHSLSLFARHALGGDSFEEHQDLKEIGEEILKKCQGLPLAITAVGGLLRTQEHQSQWEHILHSEVWDLSGRILPALLLSYHYLPSHLKRCFAACAIIPKDCEFSKKELILLWMAMGLLRQSREMNCLEDFGAKCFDDLLSRSFFQNSATSESQFVMHDLITDTAESVAGEICCRLEDMLENTKISKRARYLSFTGQALDAFENFRDFNSVQRLRTFFSFESCAHSFDLPDKVLVDLAPKFKFLRVLCLREFSISELPDYIGELKQLRHLDLSFTDIRMLPASICTLYNLLTLSVNRCFFLGNLPANIGNLINLRHLDNAHTCALKEMPCGISKLASLQTLPKFVVGKGSGLKLRELKDLMLRRSLSIDGLEDVMDSQDAEEASLKLKHDLDELELVWKSDDGHRHDEELELDVLDKLKPHGNLKKLKIIGHRCSKISSWVCDPSFRELTSISIINCRNCKSLPPLWELPMLKHLEIKDMFELRSIGVQFYNDGHSEVRNPSLLTIYFGGMPKWEEWSICRGGMEVRALFPCLRELTLSNCPKLARIPLMAVPSLSRLVFDNYSGPVLESLSDVTSMLRILRFPSSSLLRPPVYGREEEKKAILKILLNDEAIFEDEYVVPIVGMGGVGKTTLAQLLYNDEKVNRFFDLKAWVCVGFVFDKFDVLGVTKKILESLTEEPCNSKELDSVHVKLRKKLLGKKFLVVLDDIWKIECDEWNSLNLPFLAGARGSKIIVTTRFADVAKNMSSIKIRELKQLGDDHSPSLFARHALGGDSFEEHQDLKKKNNIVEGIQFPSSTDRKRLPSSSSARPRVYGREKEKKAILEFLLNNEAIFGDECVVAIVGMGGVGTTLAQLLYNDVEVNSFFDLKAWAYVGFESDKIDVLGVTKKILESLTSEPCNLKELDSVHVRLREKLSGKKFLVVLDDIWKIERDEWNSLNLPFFAGARGSKVIVTTRFAGVAKKMGRTEIRELKLLGDVHSLSLRELEMWLEWNRQT